MTTQWASVHTSVDSIADCAVVECIDYQGDPDGNLRRTKGNCPLHPTLPYILTRYIRARHSSNPWEVVSPSDRVNSVNEFVLVRGKR